MSTVTLESLATQTDRVHADATGIDLAITIKPGTYGRHTAQIWACDTTGDNAQAYRRERQAAGWAHLATRLWLAEHTPEAVRPRPRAVLAPYEAAATLIERVPESLTRELGSLADALRAMGFTVQLPAASSAR